MINSYIDLEDNNYFSKLNKVELGNILKTIKFYLLEYREKLNLPNDLTFGCEIEYERVFKFIVDKFISKNLNNWTSTNDLSIKFGGEIVSPIMTDKIQYWEELKMICNYLSQKKADIKHNSGGHVHIGCHILGSNINNWKNFLKLYTIYEHIIFRFSYGEKVSARNNVLKYAHPNGQYIYNNIDKINSAKNISEIFWHLPRGERYFALSFYNVESWNLQTTGIKNTLEFRMANATTNEIIWQNNINTFAKMLVSSKQIDEEFLNYKLTYEYLSYKKNKYRYDVINLKDALEFVDLIFNNNLDKIYFLKQYLKDFEENPKKKVLLTKNK